MEAFWDVIRRNLKEPGTKGGYFAYAFIILIVTPLVIGGLGLDIIIWDKLKIIFLIEFLWGIYWLFYSKTIIFFFKKIRIGFAIKTEEESEEHYREIKKQLIRNIENHNLSSAIQIIEFPSDLIFQEKKKAEDFADQKRMGVFIWGDTREGTWRREKISQFNVNFSYLFSASEEKSKFSADIQEFMGGRNWIVSSSNSFDNIPVVSENITETALYILGKSLASFRRLDLSLKAIEVFEQLKVSLTAQNPAVFPRIEQLKQKTNIYLDNIYTDVSLHYGNKATYYRYFNEEKEKELIKLAKEYAGRALKINKDNFLMCQNLAFFEYVEGDVEKAKEYTQRALEVRPRSPLPHFNLAFFALKDRIYKEALDEYKKIRINEEVNIIEIIAFLEKELEQYPDNLGFLFATGYLNFKYADEERGIEQLSGFLAQATKNKEFDYSPLIKEAKNLVGENKN